MKNIGDIIKLPEFKEKVARSFRESIIDEFIERILLDRKGTKYYPKNDTEMKKFRRSVAILINSNPFLKESWQYEAFLKKCKEAKVFSQCFYGLLKVKKNVEVRNNK
jgi:hypothetical protein